MAARMSRTVENLEPKIAHLIDLSVIPVTRQSGRSFVFKSQRRELVRLDSHKERLLRQSVVEIFVVRVKDHLRIGKTPTQRRRSSDVVEMAVRESDRLQLKSFGLNKPHQLRRLLTRIDADRLSRPFACDDARILLKRSQDKPLNYHCVVSLSR